MIYKFKRHITLLGSVMVLMAGCGMGETEIQSTADTSSSKNTQTVQTVFSTDTSVNRVQQHVLEQHNEKRHFYFHDSDLKYSSELEKAAQTYANTLAKKGTFEHDPSNSEYGYGENLYAHAYNAPIGIDDAMYHWFDLEAPLYNYYDGSCQEAYYDSGAKISCGHYTQMIWQDTKEVGCAAAQYKTGDFKDGYVYVCKYKNSGNRRGEKPYCLNYSNQDLYTTTVPKFQSLFFANKTFSLEIIEENRDVCTRSDGFNSSIQFNSDGSVAKIVDFQIFNNGDYANTLEFDTIYFDGDTMKMVGWNKYIADVPYQTKMVYMNLKPIGETDTYYAVEIEWNGLDMGKPSYGRTMKAKLYKP